MTMRGSPSSPPPTRRTTARSLRPRRRPPNLGISVRLEFLREEASRARELVTAQHTFKQMYLGLWVEQAERWLIRAWDKRAAAETRRPTDRLWRPRPRRDARLDDDRLGWPRTRGYRRRVVPVLDPEAALARRERTMQVAYREWVRDGLLAVTPGRVVDYGAVRRRSRGRPGLRRREIGYDPGTRSSSPASSKRQAHDDAHPAGVSRRCTIRPRPSASGSWRAESGTGATRC